MSEALKMKNNDGFKTAEKLSYILAMRVTMDCSSDCRMEVNRFPNE